jgi:high-affinity nickel-transport protein
VLSSLFTSTAFGAAVVFGVRHGFDWDHLAAITDLTGSETRPRRAMRLASLYALGHAVMVLVLGAAAILFAEEVPRALDGFMERLVGVTLITLAGWIIFTAVRTRGAPPMRSRWMLLIGAVSKGLHRWRAARAPMVVIEHDHPHDHDHAAHGHAHLDGAPSYAGAPAPVGLKHSHRHRHVAVAPLDPFASYTSRSAFGIGVLHGVGAETPTQVVIFAAAANASGRPTSIALLVCFVVGLVASNTVVAAASTLGYRRVLAHRGVALGLALVTGAFSLVVGTLLLLGHGSALPAIPGST